MDTKNQQSSSPRKRHDGRPGSGTEGDALPVLLQPQSIELRRRQFLDEFNPSGPTQRCLVDQLAAHATGRDLAIQAEMATLRQKALAVSALQSNGSDSEMLMVAGSSAVQRILQFRLGHQRGFTRCLTLLQQFNYRRTNRQSDLAPLVSRFFSESECVRHLVQRLQSGSWSCPKCQCQRGNYMPSRNCWQCAGCKRQVGIRTGTIMSHSPLPLKQWFGVVLIILARPQTPAAEISRLVKIKRHATVAQMVLKVNDTIAKPTASELLAGLDIIAQETSNSPAEPSAPRNDFLQYDPEHQQDITA